MEHPRHVFVLPKTIEENVMVEVAQLRMAHLETSVKVVYAVF